MLTALRFIEGTLVFLLIILIFGCVILRYVFSISYLWTEEVLFIIALWVFFIGGVLATEEESHIKGDMLGSLFKKPKKRKIFTTTVALYSAALSCVFLVWAIQYCMWQTDVGTLTTYLRLPKITSIYAIGVGAIFMAFLFIYHFIRYATMGVNKFVDSGTGIKIPGAEEMDQKGGEMQ